MERAKSIVKTSTDDAIQEVPEGPAPPSDAPPPAPPLERSRSIRQPSKIASVVTKEEPQSQDDQPSADPDDSSQASATISASGSADDETKQDESIDTKAPRPSIKKSIIVPAETSTSEDPASPSEDREGGAVRDGESPAQADAGEKSESPDAPADAPRKTSVKKPSIRKPSVFVSAITKEMRLSMTPLQLATAIVAEEEEFKKKEAEKNAPPVVEKPPTPPPTPEVRALPFIPKPNPKILYKIEREMSVEKCYLMGKRVHGGPKAPESCSFFVVGDIGQRYEVKIRQFLSCQCGDYLEMRLCKHIMFVMLKFFKLGQGDHRIWQRALLKSELQSLLSDPRITPPSPKLIKKKFISKLFPPKAPSLKQPSVVTDPVTDSPSEAQDDRALGPQFCPVCLEQFNFIAETPEIPYLGPIPWKPKFMPKLDMAPPASIKKKRDEKKRLQDAIKKHQEDRKKPAGEPEGSKDDSKGVEKKDEKEVSKDDSDREIDGGDPKSEENGNLNLSDPQAQSAEQKPVEELEPQFPLRNYETILYCPKPECRGDDKCFKLVHEWCYRKLDNFGLYPRGRAVPTYCLM